MRMDLDCRHQLPYHVLCSDRNYLPVLHATFDKSPATRRLTILLAPFMQAFEVYCKLSSI